MRPTRDRLERALRGGVGSSIVHAALASLMLIPWPAIERPSAGASTGIVLPFVTALPSDLAPQRDPDRPFRDEPSANLPPGEIPLSLDNGPNGGGFAIDLARIRERRNDLFPFVTWNLRFLTQRPWGDDTGTLQFQTGLGPAPPNSGAALALSPEQVQALVDRAFSRRHRWSNLAELVDLAERHDGDNAALAGAFRSYVQQNIPQPYEDWTDADPVFWITLMLAADDAPLVEFVARYLRRHPANRVSTELLFLLDASAESSCDVLRRVLLAGTPDLPLTVTQLDNPDAYDLASSLATAYRGWVVRHRANLRERCSTVRVAILRRIIDTSPDGYGVADARFRLGQLLWLANRQAEAAEWWEGMAPDARDQYPEARRQLRGAIADGAHEFNPSRVSRILADEERRWRTAAGGRLEHFGVLATEF